MTTLRWIRVLLVIVIVGLLVSGITVFPLNAELRWASDVLHASPAPDLLPGLVAWIDTVRDAVIATDAAYPFLAYGYDWLAFAHIMIAVAFLGPLRDPVKNVWVIQWGLIMCFAIIPLALIAGTVRGLPWGWQLIDIAFVVAAVPLFIALRLTRKLEREAAEAPAPDAP